jgi:uncharacterized membrane protein YhaH (DUF805 family)
MFMPLRKYATFGGRASRAEYWWFWLFSIVVVSIGLAIDVLVLGSDAITSSRGLGLVSGIATLVLALPSLAVQVRRLHDQEKSGWFILLNLIPLIGGLIILWFNIRRGTPGTNIYGEDPIETRQLFT